MFFGTNTPLVDDLAALVKKEALPYIVLLGEKPHKAKLIQQLDGRSLHITLRYATFLSAGVGSMNAHYERLGTSMPSFEDMKLVLIEAGVIKLVTPDIRNMSALEASITSLVPQYRELPSIMRSGNELFISDIPYYLDPSTSNHGHHLPTLLRTLALR